MANLGSRILDWFKGIFAWIWEHVIKGFTTIHHNLGALTLQILKGEYHGQFDGVKDWIHENITEPWTLLLNPGDDLTAQQAEELSTKLLQQSLTLSLAMWIAEVAGEALSLGQIDRIGEGYKKVDTALGLSRITRLRLRIPVELAVLRPLGYRYNKQFRTFKPQMRDCIGYFSRGHIGDEKFQEMLEFHGWEEGWFNATKRYAAKPASYFMLNAIGREGLYDEDKFKFFLSDAGYGAFPITSGLLSDYERDYGLTAPNTSCVDFLAEAYKRMSSRVEFSGIKSLAKRAYKAGIITADDYRHYMKIAFVGDDVIELQLKLIDAQNKGELEDLSRTVTERLYREGIITKEELRQRLEAKGYTEASINSLVEYADLQKIPSRRKITIGALNSALKKGIITDQYYMERVLQLGYTEEDATIYYRVLKGG